jgi:hydroxymethylpyrimidine/phosphomethylpyrimidine kinase
MSNPDGTPAPSPEEASSEELPSSPACVMCFNVNDPSGASGISADITTVASMGAHALPVITGVLIRDTAEVLDSYDIDTEALADQARVILEDTTISAWKVGFLGSAEGVSAVAEIISDYSDIPLVAYLSHMSWLDEERQVSYMEAFKELILPSTTVLVGNHQILTDCLLPDWEADRAPLARELAIAAHELGVQFVLVTGMPLPDQWIDNVLANAQGAITGERFERIETNFVGAGDTLSAALTAILATTDAMDTAAAEALSFLDQSLDAGFKPGMGHAVPDRFFWALPPDEATEEGTAEVAQDIESPQAHMSRHVH